MRALNKKIICMIAIMATVILLPLIAFAADGSKINVGISFGFDNCAKGGRYLPLHVEYDNPAGSDFNGSLSVYTRESDDKICEYRNTVSIPAGEKQAETYYIPLGIRATSIHLKMSDASGSVQLDRDVNLGINSNNAQLFIGILSDTPEKLKYLDDVSVNYGLIRTKTFTLADDSFPRESKGLDMLDVIAVSNYSIRNLDEAQSHALMEWVRAGGVLILGTGERVDDTLGRYAPELLDDMYEDPEPCEVNLLSGPRASEEENSSIELACVDVAIHGGNVVSQDLGITLLTSVNKENGLIVVASYDLADTAEFAAAHQSYAADLISHCFGSERLDELAGELYGSDNTEYDSISSLIGSGDRNRIPPLGIYAFSIFAFILLAGPGLYMFLKSRDLSRLYRIGVLILSVCFTVIIFLMGSRTRFNNTFYNYATIYNIDEDTITETAFLNIQNPYNRSYAVSIAPGYTTYPVRKKEAVSRITEDWSEPIDVSTVISRSAEGTAVGIGEVGAFTPQYFRLEKNEENADGAAFDGYISLFGNELNGYVTNNCPYEVMDASLVFYGKMVALGDMKTGETIELDELKVINIPLSDSREAAALITEDEDRRNTFAFYRDYYMNGYTADVHLIAFRNPQGENPIVENADLSGSGVSIQSTELSVDSREDDSLYRSVMIKNPSVISGTCNITNNTMYVNEPCVIEYELGSDLQLKSVIFEWMDQESFSKRFTGTVSLYNYSTGNYDSIDMNKSVFDIEELDYYLSPSDSLTIRYDYEGSSQDYAALPLISVVGVD